MMVNHTFGYTLFQSAADRTPGDSYQTNAIPYPHE